VIRTGSGQSIAYRQWTFYANGEFIQVHPPENIFDFHDEMGRRMTGDMTVIRYDDGLRATDDKLPELIRVVSGYYLL